MVSKWAESSRRNEIVANGLTKKQLRRFHESYRKSGRCWIWQKRKDYKGYGVFYAGLISLRAHRVALILASGLPPAPDLQACHKCLKTPDCVNPNHLYWGTASDNVADAKPYVNSRSAAKIASLNYKRYISDADVIKIFHAYHFTKVSAKHIGNKFGISGEQVRAIGKRKVRKALTERLPSKTKKHKYPLRTDGYVGQYHHKAKLTESDVQNIRKALCRGKSARFLADRYGVTPPSISFIAVGRTWKQLPWPKGCAPRLSRKKSNNVVYVNAEGTYKARTE